MELTGKCKEEFEKWFCLNDNVNEDYYVDADNKFTEFRCIHFTEFPQSMQYGVLVDFFDSVGIEINLLKSGLINYYKIDDISYSHSYKLNSRPEARIKAIEKANEIRNLQLK